MAARERGLNVEIFVIGRDQTILNNQQTRIREENTTRHFLDALSAIQESFPTPRFLSYELLYLYKQEYLKSLNIGIPIAWYDKRVNQILERDANEKYINYVNDNPLDDGNKTGVPFLWDPNHPDANKPLTKDTDHAYDEGSNGKCC